MNFLVVYTRVFPGMICGVRTEKDDCISMDTLFIFVWITKDSNKVICKWSFACVSLVGAGKGGCKVCLNENEKDTDSF